MAKALASLSALARASRPYSLPYVAGLGALGLAAVSPKPSASQWAAAALLGPLSWVLCVAANDRAHRAADQKTRPERSRWSLGPWGFGFALGIVLLLWNARAVSWGLCLSVIASAVGYGLCKSWPVLALTFRGASGGALVLLGASLGAPERAIRVLSNAASADRELLMIALAVAQADLIGNLLGDVRDRRNDERAGTNTLATRSRTVALGLAGLLHCALLVAAFSLVPLDKARIVIGLCGLVTLWSLLHGLADASRHLAYLVWKYVLTAALFASVGRAVPSWLLVSAVPPAIAAYLWLHPSAWPTLRAGAVYPPAERE